MCIGIPGQILSIDGETAIMTSDGLESRLSLTMLPKAKIGDWVLVHAGFAISIIDADEALETLRLFAELRALAGGPHASR